MEEKPKTILLCTFSNKKRINKTISEIFKNYKIFQDKLYIFEDVNKKNILITYNIIFDENSQKKHLPKTIIVQRKKESNTIYTINALNQLIYLLNDGKIDKNFIIPWNRYKNSILIITDQGFQVMKLKLLEIRKLNNSQDVNSDKKYKKEKEKSNVIKG